MLVVASSRTRGSPGTAGSSRESTPPPVVGDLDANTPGHDDRDASPAGVGVQIDDAVVELGLGEIDPHAAQVRAHVRFPRDLPPPHRAAAPGRQSVPQRGHRPNSSTVWSTAVNPASAATLSAHCSTARPSTSTLAPQGWQIM
jgi:hypothetical protein